MTSNEKALAHMKEAQSQVYRWIDCLIDNTDIAVGNPKAHKKVH